MEQPDRHRPKQFKLARALNQDEHQRREEIHTYHNPQDNSIEEN